MIILALSGSLRAQSVNSAFCRVFARLAPPGIAVNVYGELGTLPIFNPDLDSLPPAPVVELRRQLDAADVLLIASPEYAHGISGPLKNALDWLVAHEAFYAKPVSVVNTSPRAHHAYDSLLEVLRTMSASLIEDACVSIPLLGHVKSEEAMLGDNAICAAARRILDATRAHAASSETVSGP
jgi:chromate reductase, NAD(P)H dehydrogenase (quinone)